MLTIVGKDGSRRIINVHPSFYLDPKTGDKVSNGVLAGKITDIVSDYMKYKDLYEAVLMLGTQKVIHIKNDHNQPTKFGAEPKIDERDALKDLKKDLSSKQFTVRMVLGKKGFDVIQLKTSKLAA